MSTKQKLYPMCLSAVFLALAILLPLLTGEIPQIGKSLCPMHIPVFLCGFFCGPLFGLIVGIIAPLLRFFIFGMPILMPTGIGMCFELGAYGFFSGLLYKILPKKKVCIYISLIFAMIAGRIIWGITRVIMYGVFKSKFGWAMFISGGFLNAVPGIIIQIVLIPIIVMALEKYTIHK